MQREPERPIDRRDISLLEPSQSATDPHLSVVNAPTDERHIRDLDPEFDEPLPLATTERGEARSSRKTMRAAVVAFAAADAAVALAGLAFVLRAIPEATLASGMRLGAGAAVGLLWIGVFHLFGLYSTQQLRAADEFRRVAGASGAAGATVMAFGAGTLPPTALSRLGITFIAILVGEIVVRSIGRSVLSALRSSGALAVPTLIVGTDDAAARLAAKLTDPALGFHPVGRVAVAGQDIVPGLPVVGTTEYLTTSVQASGAACIFVSATPLAEQEQDVIRKVARRQGLELRYFVDVPESLSNRLTLHHTGALSSVSLRPARLTRTQALLKRTCDVVVSSVAMLFAFPVVALVAAAVKVTSRGPVLFRQDRVTEGGRSFVMYKFRTMAHNADTVLDDQGVDRKEAFFKADDDAPFTPVGRQLRRWSLDELPQLWNVITGDMSIVGPRPLPVDQVESNFELLAPRHEVRAGMTGWWQVSGRSETNAKDAVGMDVLYIENWSLGFDLWIMLKTVRALVAPRGAR